MILQFAFLLLAASTTALLTSEEKKALSDDTHFPIDFILPDFHHAEHSTLEVKVTFNKGDILASVIYLKLYVSLPRETAINHLLAEVDSNEVVKGTEETNFDLTGSQWSLDLVWHGKYDGYCRSYMARILGTDKTGEKYSTDKTFRLGCIGEIPEYIKIALPDATYLQQFKALKKFEAIDTNTFKLSDVYKNHIYAVSRANGEFFDLHRTNELCKSNGGYLVEFDDTEEQAFVRAFIMKKMRALHYFTGANDVENEGHFVYYNSKKPVTNVKWAKGQPNNWKRNQDCVLFRKGGLNDITCNRKWGFICEIPLF